MYLKEMPNCGIPSDPTETARHPTYHSYGQNRHSDQSGQGVGRGRGSAIELLPKRGEILQSPRSHLPAVGLHHLGRQLGRTTHPVLELALFQNDRHAVVILGCAWCR